MAEPTRYEIAVKKHDQKIRSAERAHDRNDVRKDAFNESADRHALAIIRIFLTLNGGAAIALLAFVGGLAARSTLDLDRVMQITGHLKWFVVGVIANGVAAGVGYFVTFSYTASAHYRTNSWEWPYVEENAKSRLWKYTGYTLHGLALLCATVGFSVFCYGMYKVQLAIGKIR